MIFNKRIVMIIILLTSFLTGCSNSNNQVESEIIKSIETLLSDIKQESEDTIFIIENVHYVFEQTISFESPQGKKSHNECYFILIDTSSTSFGKTTIWLLLDKNYELVKRTMVGIEESMQGKRYFLSPIPNTYIQDKQIFNYMDLENPNQLTEKQIDSINK